MKNKYKKPHTRTKKKKKLCCNEQEIAHLTRKMVLFQKTDKSLNSSFKTFLSTSEQTYTTCELCLPETQSSVNSLTAFSLWPLLAAEHSP